MMHIFMSLKGLEDDLMRAYMSLDMHARHQVPDKLLHLVVCL
jgi:hypothetical protein